MYKVDHSWITEIYNKRFFMISLFDTVIFTDTMKNKSVDANDILPQRMTRCLATMDIFLQQPFPVLSSMVIAEKHKSTNKGDIVDLDQVVANILGFENVHSMNLNDSFEKLGVDSLGYTEIKQILEREYNIVLSFQEILALTISKLRNLVMASDVSHDSSTS